MAEEPSHTLSHPLFPVDEETEDDDIKPISWISISRVENGRSLVAPRQRRADELQSLDQLHAEFGGGTYVLRAFHAGRIVTQRKYDLPGKSKPLYDEGPEEKPAQVQPASPSTNPMTAMIGGEQGGFMGFLIMMMQQLMQQSAQAQQQQTQMFIAMMNNQHSSSAEEKAAARAELAASVERERINSERQMAFMKEMMASRGGGGGSEDFTRGVEFMRTFATQQIEMAKMASKGEDSDGLNSLLETLGMAFQAAQATGMFKGAVPEGVQQVAEVAEAAGG